ncbi:hypothetical protein [Desulfobulbus elongatus]|uniref:hypothetical protein n=1 Tax=Desulfobulbus elongatus TaxID=53332 RepID=UPI000AB4EEF8|nr:hypothetical protein [Desulfobulbus elongatus]
MICDVYVRGKYRDVILPMTVIRSLDTLPSRLIGNVTNGQVDIHGIEAPKTVVEKLPEIADKLDILDDLVDVMEETEA